MANTSSLPDDVWLCVANRSRLSQRTTEKLLNFLQPVDSEPILPYIKIGSLVVDNNGDIAWNKMLGVNHA